MAPQRRGAPKAPEGSAAAERRRASSAREDVAPRTGLGKLLKAAALGACAALATLLLWSSSGSDDGVTEVLAPRGEVLPGRFIEVPCSEDYDSQRRFEGCTPRKCGRGVTDAKVTREEAERIRRYFGDKIHTVFSEEDLRLYRDVRRKVQLTIAEAFGVSPSSLYLTKPTFFSRINSTGARTAHDEYWHAHVDKVTYGSFDYTSLLYLSDYLEDFGGGRFVFMDDGANRTVEPRTGRFPSPEQKLPPRPVCPYEGACSGQFTRWNRPAPSSCACFALTTLSSGSSHSIACTGASPPSRG
nr:2-oxoglutarate and iron-dependent oxygenase domain-containing protein 3 isoform X4 [Dasypus novemcinctus]